MNIPLPQQVEHLAASVHLGSQQHELPSHATWPDDHDMANSMLVISLSRALISIIQKCIHCITKYCNIGFRVERGSRGGLEGV
jgi:hypothetical protein